MNEQMISFDNRTHRIGRFWTAFMIIIMICIPLGICVIFKTKPNFSAGFWAAFIPILLMDIPSGIGELAAYAPFLGTGGTYLGFITGNLSNLKVPCVMTARKLANTEVGTQENEIVSTISIAVSAITTTLVIALGVLFIRPLTPVLESTIMLPAFKTVIPAMFGALGIKYAISSPKASIIPLVAGILLFLLVPSLTSSVSIMVFVLAVLGGVSAIILYKVGFLK